MAVTSEIRKTVAGSKRFCDDLRKKRDDAMEIIHRFTEVIDSENLLKLLPGEIASAQKAVDEGVSQIAVLEPQADSLTVRNDQLALKIDAREAELADLRSETGSLKAAVDARVQKSTAVDGLNAEISALEKSKTGINAKIKEHEVKIEELENELVPLQDDLGNNRQEVEKFRSDIEQLSDEIATLTEELKVVEGAGGKKRKLARLTEENERIAKKNSGLKDAIARDGQAKAKIKADTEARQNDIEGIDSELIQLDSTMVSLTHSVLPQDEIGRLQAEYDVLLNERAALGSKVDNLECEIKGGDGVKDEIEEIRRELEAVGKEFKEFREKVGVYHEDPERFEQLKGRLQTMEETEAGYRAKASEAEGQLMRISRLADVSAVKMKAYREPVDEINDILNS